LMLRDERGHGMLPMFRLYTQDPTDRFIPDGQI
jgi:hypothetical protein